MRTALGYFLACASLSLAALLHAGCGSGERPLKVDLEGPGQPPGAAPQGTLAPLRVATGGIITPKEGLTYYRDLVDYVARRLGREPVMVERATYQEINDMLRDGQVDMAFVCTGPYVDAKRSFDLEILAVPQVDGRSVYHSYILVPEESPYRSLEDLSGKRFAMTDPLSHTGCQYPKLLLARMGETPESFFSKVEFTGAHDKSIRAVSSNIVDGAAIDHLIWRYMEAKQPEVTRRVRIIHESPPFGMPPLVANPLWMDPPTRERIRALMVEMADDPDGAAILRNMLIERFVPGDDRAYESVRRFQEEYTALSGKGAP